MAKRAFASIAEFFSTRREALSNRVSGSSLRIFLGNEACDADSIISSVCMSYLQYNQLDAQTVVLPVLPLTNREELYLRPEAVSFKTFFSLSPSVQSVFLSLCNHFFFLSLN